MKSTKVPIGSLAPDFDYTDRSGSHCRLAAHRGRSVVLVFFRGHWCQSCRRQLAQLGTTAGTIRSLGSDLLAISADESTPSGADSLDVPTIVDTELRIIDRYGIRDLDDSEGRAIARPSVFILDPTGIVRFCHVGTHRQDRPAMGAILLAVESIAANIR